MAMGRADMMTSQPAILEDVLDALEAELASFSNPGGQAQAPQSEPPEAQELPVCANDDLPDDSSTHFVIAAYRAC